ncbi:hypothetical protein QYE76_030534 [Lolium multiflorum]|uniref:Uncharacterized protein n=1 Tax=Lolium multiflorum TaxID=4521 RepID=A0AAD8VIW4_LOLMU|nr:hypothetical protein QYE76_030534 [Lolium multiflorum]
MPFSRVILLLMSSTLRVLPFGVSLILFVHRVCHLSLMSDCAADLEFQRVFEFLSRLRKEFEPRRAQLLARGRVPLSEVLAELCAKETRLRGAGLLEVPSVLAARGPPVPSARGPPMPPASLQSQAPSILSTPPVQGQSQPQQPRGWFFRIFSVALSDEDIIRGLRGLLVHRLFLDGTVGCARLFGTARPPPPTLREYISQHLPGVLAEQGTLA